MGLILDSSVLVAAERQGQNARQMLASIAGKIVETEIGISVITLTELAHGAARSSGHRAHRPARRTNRWRESDPRKPGSSFRSSDRRNRARARLQRGNDQSPPLPAGPGPDRRAALA